LGELAALGLGLEGHRFSWCYTISPLTKPVNAHLWRDTMRVRVALGILSFLALASITSAQTTNFSQFAGAWERFSLRDETGKMVSPQPPAPFLIMTADGFFSQTAIPTGRPKSTKALKDMTKDELLARFNQVVGRHGTYSVSGNRLTRTDLSNIIPNNEGMSQVQLFKLEGDVLILSNPATTKKDEVRFRRVKKST
jgi:hypothetical protein